MKVLIVNGSSHVNGTTMQAIKEVQKVFTEANVDTEVIQLGNKLIRDCIQCGYCFEHGECVFKDDDVNAFVEKAKDADGFIFATPVLLCTSEWTYFILFQIAYSLVQKV